MEIKLNKELQKKLDDFLETKDAKMQEFLEILNLNEFTFSQDEINQVEKIYKENEDLYEYAYIYIGEAYIHLIGGKWRLNTTKKRPCLWKNVHCRLGKRSKKNRPYVHLK